MDIRFPNESPEYRAARLRLLDREVALRRAMEEVAEARRALPPGGTVPEDHAFQGLRPDGSAGEVRLSELFGGHRTLAIYHFMFPRSRSDERPGPAAGGTALLPLHEGPCPSCTALLDQLDGAGPHVARRMAFAVVAKAPLPRLLAFARERGWRHLRLVSSEGSRFGRDYLAESQEGGQQPMMNVFTRDGDMIRHFWGAELLYAPTEPGQEMRHVGTLEPLWNMLDLGPEGRGEGWEEQLEYSCCGAAARA